MIRAAVWPGARWESRPVDNAWWRNGPSHPPITDTDETHLLYGQLAARHCGWHCHGAFTALPAGAWVAQRNAAGEPITWQLDYGAGKPAGLDQGPHRRARRTADPTSGQLQRRPHSVVMPAAAVRSLYGGAPLVCSAQFSTCGTVAAEPVPSL